MSLIKYTRLFAHDIMSEMSFKRRHAEKRIMSEMIPLGVHLVALLENPDSLDREKYIHGINTFRTNIQKLNRKKGSPGKAWFSHDVLDSLFDSSLSDLDVDYTAKYGVEPTKEYSRNDFPEFQWDAQYSAVI